MSNDPITSGTTSSDSNSPKPANERFFAARALVHVVQHNRTVDWVEAAHPQWLANGLNRDLVYGTLRYYFRLSEIVIHCLDKPLRSKDTDLMCLLLVGAYQLQYTSISAHAAVNETVKACKFAGKPWAKGLVNAVLRRISGKPKPPERSFDQPKWIIDRVINEYGPNADELLLASTQRAPMTLRVNQSKYDPANYKQKLREAQIQFSQGGYAETLILDAPRKSRTLPGWDEGLVAVQDQGAQCATHLLLDESKPGAFLDACCAPGGKLCHLLEQRSALTISTNSSMADSAHPVVGLDISSTRLESTRAIAARLGHNPTIIEGDATLRDWWDGNKFANILLDAPCSGSGTLRRHPDIKILLTPEAVTTHSTQQLQTLNNLWHLLDSGGNLLYCTCSIFSEENDQVIDRFIKNNKDARVTPIHLTTGCATQHGWQLLPIDPTTDGFYFCLLSKPAADMPKADPVL